jgi:hypothetical protein
LLGLDFHGAVRQFEKLSLKTALEKARGNPDRAAHLLNFIANSSTRNWKSNGCRIWNRK